MHTLSEAIEDDLDQVGSWSLGVDLGHSIARCRRSQRADDLLRPCVVVPLLSYAASILCEFL